MTLARDFDDIARDDGLDAVRDALRSARDTLPPIGPYDEERAAPVALTATPFAWRDEADIPPRRWLYGKHLLRKFLSLDVAAGGIGKSSLKIGEALEMTSGRTIYGKDMPEGLLTVWLYNLEDPADETERRLHAAAKRFHVSPDQIGDRLYADSGRDQPLTLAVELDGGARIQRPVVDALIAELQSRRVDVMIVDPFVSSHQVSENDNRAIDLVAKQWAQIADACDCSINLVHHVRKQNGQEATADSARGASALIGAARSVMVYNRMTKEEAEEAGVPKDQASFYFRIQNDKANLSPPDAAEWFRMNNVDLANGDQVGVACPWQWPDAFQGVTTQKLMEVQRAVGEGEWRKDVRSGVKWVGNIIATTLGMDPEDDKKRLGSIIKQWLKTDVLREVERDDENRRPRLFVEVGTWVAE